MSTAANIRAASGISSPRRPRANLEPSRQPHRQVGHATAVPAAVAIVIGVAGDVDRRRPRAVRRAPRAHLRAARPRHRRVQPPPRFADRSAGLHASGARLSRESCRGRPLHEHTLHGCVAHHRQGLLGCGGRHDVPPFRAQGRAEPRGHPAIGDDEGAAGSCRFLPVEVTSPRPLETRRPRPPSAAAGRTARPATLARAPWSAAMPRRTSGASGRAWSRSPPGHAP